jgi:hypothetical protein
MTQLPQHVARALSQWAPKTKCTSGRVRWSEDSLTLRGDTAREPKYERTFVKQRELVPCAEDLLRCSDCPSKELIVICPGLRFDVTFIGGNTARVVPALRALFRTSVFIDATEGCQNTFALRVDASTLLIVPSHMEQDALAITDNAPEHAPGRLGGDMQLHSSVTEDMTRHSRSMVKDAVMKRFHDAAHVVQRLAQWRVPMIYVEINIGVGGAFEASDRERCVIVVCHSGYTCVRLAASMDSLKNDMQTRARVEDVLTTLVDPNEAAHADDDFRREVERRIEKRLGDFAAGLNFTVRVTCWRHAGRLLPDETFLPSYAESPTSVAMRVYSAVASTLGFSVTSEPL